MTLTRFAFGQLKYARRYNRIIRVLLRHGFDDYVASHSSGRRYWLLRLLVSSSRRRRAASHNKWERMRMVCEDLGPTFVKFGQLLSNRRDLIPAPLIVELTRLQDNVPPFPSRLVRKIVKDELKGDPEELFAEFSDVPFASASMAQVHKARLKTGEEVVLKIQRPQIRKQIEDDLKIMRKLAAMLAKQMPSVRHFDPEGLVEQFAASIFYEMDFLHEAVNMKRFQNQVKNHPHIRVPKVYDEFSTHRVLTMQYVQGVKPVDADRLKQNNIDPDWVARMVIESFFDQAFVKGYFHADPHAGNLLVTNDNHIYFIDFGMMGTILKKDMQHLGALVLAIEKEDVRMLMRAISTLTDTPYFENKRRLEYDLIEYINRFAFTSDYHLRISEMLTELVVIIRDHNLKVPAHFFLLIRATFSVEGLVRHISPQIELMDILRPIIQKRIVDEMNPLNSGQRLAHALYDLAGYLEEFPNDMRLAMRMLRRGKFKVDLEHKGMDPFVYTLRRVSQQTVAAIVISAILITSTILVLLKVGPQWENTSILGLVGFGVAAVSAFTLFLRMRRLKQEFEDREME